MRRDLRFGRFRFHPSSGELWAGRREVRLTPRAAGVLAALVERAGEAVSRRQLFAAVWGDAFVGDDALTSCIQELRRALGDDARRPRFIETRHRRGYRFVAEVVEERVGPAAPPPAGTEPPPAAASIAVLPFADMSPGHDLEYLCDGLAEEIAAALTRVAGLRVAARSSAFRFRGPAADARAVGRQLRVAHLLAGSVRKMDDRLRVSVQLVDAASGFHRWSRRFDRAAGDVFALQEEIAESVATELGGVLRRSERDALRRPETQVAAYELYLRGRQHLHRMRRPDLERSRELFARAIELDPAYAPAWAGLATVHATLYEWWGARDEDLEAADRASRMALAAAPALAQSHVARGVALSLSGRYAEAAQELAEAIAIDPRLFDAYYYAARSRFAAGDFAGSAELFRKAAEVRQEDFQSPILLGQSLAVLGRAEEAAAANREGIARAERVLELNPFDGRALSLGAIALFIDGQPERAFDWSRRALELDPDDMSALVNGACLRSRAGHVDDALELLERLFSRGWGKRDWIEHDPDYDPLRGDPRFQRLLAGLK